MTREEHDALFQSLFGFHRRMERQLAHLIGLSARGGATPDAEAAECAIALLRCFEDDCRRRHAEEERELWPRIDRALPADAHRGAFRALRRRLAEQHREVEHAWRGLRRPLEAIAEGIPRRIDPVDAGFFRHLCTSHIHEEEMALQRVAALRWEVDRHESVTVLKRA